MDSSRLLAIGLIVAGVLALGYGGFTYTRNTSEAKIGPLDLQVRHTETVNIPIWVGVAAIALGGGLLVMGNRRL